MDEIKIDVWERLVGDHRSEGNPMRYQCDILIGLREYHGRGENPAEAVMRAAALWRQREFPRSSPARASRPGGWPTCPTPEETSRPGRWPTCPTPEER